MITSNYVARLAGLAASLSLFAFHAAAADKAEGPNCRPNTMDDYFHPKAIRLEQSGVVLIEYSVTAKGRAERVEVLKSTAPKVLQDSAIRLVKSFKCKPDAEWIAAGGLEQRLKLNVVFEFKGQTPLDLIDPGAEQVRISTSPIGSAP